MCTIKNMKKREGYERSRDIFDQGTFVKVKLKSNESMRNKVFSIKLRC